MFAKDKVHLSPLGNEILLHRLQTGIQSFLSSDVVVSPLDGECGPWLNLD